VAASTLLESPSVLEEMSAFVQMQRTRSKSASMTATTAYTEGRTESTLTALELDSHHHILYNPRWWTCDGIADFVVSFSVLPFCILPQPSKIGPLWREIEELLQPLTEFLKIECDIYVSKN
jgi:hypothetical protein